MSEVAEGQVAAVVTFLEMTEPPAGEVPNSTLALSRIDQPSADEYRALFRLVGARWLWFSRLIMADETLLAIVAHPDVELYVVEDGGEPAGMVELDFRAAGECELAFIGLIPKLAGQGHGRWLLGQALRRAWRPGVGRVHVHTCSLDHPAALPTYLRSGFVAYKRAIERFADPRLLGILPPDCAPQLPLIGTVTGVASPSPASWT